MNDPLFGNKLAAALLTATLLFFGLPQVTHALLGGGGHHASGHDGDHHPFPAFPVEFAVAAATAEDAAPELDLGTRLAAASAAGGERRAAICASCHSFEKGGANGTGPNLWNIVNREVAGVDGFNYSNALREFGGAWTYERLDGYLENSKAYVPGTNMAQRFPKPEHRADLLAYLRTFADNPAPLPEPTPAPASAGEPEESSEESAGE